MTNKNLLTARSEAERGVVEINPDHQECIGWCLCSLATIDLMASTVVLNR